MDTPQPWEVDQVRDRVGKRVAEFLHAQRTVLDDISADLGGLVDTLDDFMAGGKKLRAVFLYWGWRSGGGPDNDAVISAAAAMEFLQACALVHDDVMDRSDQRRGQPAVHRQYASLHERAAWCGSAERFGDAAAILIGDLCLSWADILLLSAELPADALARAKPVYDSMRVELMAGQYLDVLEQARSTPDAASALRVATYKSAKYTIERPLHLGAALAGADPVTTGHLRSYGLALGRAFQLRDDLLGVFGDPAQTGKPRGDDLREGKRTVLIALAETELSGAQRQQFEDWFGNTSAPGAELDRLTEAVARSGARERVEEMIAQYTATAAAELHAARLDPTCTAVLSGLIDAAAVRAS